MTESIVARRTKQMEEYVIPTTMLVNIEMMDRMQHSMSWKRVSMDGCLIFVYFVENCFLVSGLVFPQLLLH
jgi:hypothetical protein